MLEMLAESFSGCVYMYVRVLWRLLASPRLASAVYCPHTPPHTPLVNGCSHPSPSLLLPPQPSTRAWQGPNWLVCSLPSKGPELNLLAMASISWPTQICPLFSEAFFFLLLFLEDRHFISLLCVNPPALSTYYSSCDRDQRVWVHVCLCAHVCPLRAQKSVCLQAQMSPGPSTELMQKKKKCIHVYAKTCHHGFIVCAL